MSSVHPPNGPTSGGAALTLDGQAFQAAALVRFDTVVLTPTVAATSTRLVVAVPARAAGTYELVVRNNGHDESDQRLEYTFHGTEARVRARMHVSSHVARSACVRVRAPASPSLSLSLFLSQTT